ncbi:hypothetical protein AVEN_80259-2-1, partial [Araneus ventricosus]
RSAVLKVHAIKGLKTPSGLTECPDKLGSD